MTRNRFSNAFCGLNITCISDTHNLHRQLKLMSGDLLIHCGDVTERGTEAELLDFLDWFAEQDFKHKIFIGGNHDSVLEAMPLEKIKMFIPKGVTYLQNEAIELNGLKIFGSPNTKGTSGRAFCKTAEELALVYAAIPHDTQILLTHEAPFGLNDRNQGSEVLLEYVKRIKPAYHIYGHKHDAYGKCEIEGTFYINCALCAKHDYTKKGPLKLIYPPVELEIEV